MEKIIQNIPFLRIAIALVAGVILGNQLNINPNISFAFCIFVLVVLIVLNNKYKYVLTVIFGFLVQIFFVSLGIFATTNYNQKPLFFNNGHFVAVVLENPQEKANSYKSLLQIETFISSDSVQSTDEIVIAYFNKTDTARFLKPGDVILFNSSPKQVSNFNNPYEFNYKRYLGSKKIYRQVYLPSDQWHMTNKTKTTLGIKAEQIREKLLTIYRNQPLDDTELEILSALTLGYKRKLDQETKMIFAASGASHVLAVSGLHVGIIYWVIFMVFGFLRKSKSGRIIFVLLAVVLLWMYTFVTGLSPSVMRAATMFTIFIIGENLNRKSNIYNSLAASAFILLLINPNNLSDVGFQLSYTAVFGIVFLQPKLEKLITVKNKYLNFFWTLITVSIAAQIATFPLTTYYFGQFPLYFWLTNVFIIPVVMLLIPLGISLLLVSKVQIIASILAFILNTVIKLSYAMLLFIQQLPFSVFEVSVNHIQLIFNIAIICSIFLFLQNQKPFYFKTALFSVFLLSIITLTNKIVKLNNTEIIVYNSTDNQTIHLIKGVNNYIISEKPVKDEDKNFHPGIITAKKIGLKEPVFLQAKDELTNNDIVLKNNFAFFEGKTLSINKKLSELNKNNFPDFIIIPKIDNINTESNVHTTIITNKSFLPNSMRSSIKIHNISHEGAFRKKW